MEDAERRWGRGAPKRDESKRDGTNKAVNLKAKADAILAAKQQTELESNLDALHMQRG